MKMSIAEPGLESVKDAKNKRKKIEALVIRTMTTWIRLVITPNAGKRSSNR